MATLANFNVTVESLQNCLVLYHVVLQYNTYLHTYPFYLAGYQIPDARAKKSLAEMIPTSYWRERRERVYRQINYKYYRG